jgi:hypothetical protein
MNNTKQNMNTEYIKLTDLWQDGQYIKVGKIINQESWNPARVAEFCAYLNKYLGSTQLNVLHKLL